MSKHFTLSREDRNIASLSIHPIIREVGYIKPDDLYISDLTYLGLIKPVIITDDNLCLTSPDYLEAARTIGEKTIAVIVIKDATVNTILRLINFESRGIYRANKSILFKTIRMLESHLWNTDAGKEWALELKGDSINDKIGNLVGFGPSTISLVKFIGKNNYALLDSIDDPESDMTLTRAQQIVKDSLDATAKKDNLEDVNITNLPPELKGNEDDKDDLDSDGEEVLPGNSGTSTDAEKPKDKVKKNSKPGKVKVPCDVTLTDFSLGLGKYGDFKLDLTSGRPAMLYNDAFAGNVSITAKDSNDLSEGLYFVIQHTELAWSFHITATRIDNITKEKEVNGEQA